MNDRKVDPANESSGNELEDLARSLSKIDPNAFILVDGDSIVIDGKFSAEIVNLLRCSLPSPDEGRSQ